MDRRQARRILGQLAAGRNPETGGALGARNPVQRPDVIRALNFAVDILDGSRQVSVHSGKPRAPRRPKRARQSYRPWTAVEERAVQSEWAAGKSIAVIARDCARSPNAVRARLTLLEGDRR